MHIRTVTLADADTLLNFSKKTFFDAFAQQNTAENMAIYAAQAFTIEQMERELSNPESEFYFVEDEGVLVGYIKLNFGSAQAEFQEQEGVEISRIYVSAGHQNKNIGGLLINHAASIAQSRALNYIWLGVWESNTRAIRFYQRNGFEAFQTHYFMLGNDEQTDVLMRRPLTPYRGNDSGGNSFLPL